ncbi:hypothetical protein D3C77_558410 [compost metagenome]
MALFLLSGLLVAHGDLQWLMKLRGEGRNWQSGDFVVSEHLGRLNDGDGLGLLYLSAVNLRKATAIASG